MTTGELIRQARKNAGLTQKQLGERCGMADSAIRKYESGRITPKAETLKRIAAALNVQWFELYSDDPHVQARGIVDDVSSRLQKAIKKSGPMVKTPSTFSEIVQFNSENEKALFLYTNLNESGRYEAARFFTEHLDKDSIPEVISYLQQLVDTPQYQKKSEE